MNERTSYLGHTIIVTNTGYVVKTGHARVEFKSMRNVRTFIRHLRRVERQERAA